MGSVYFIFFVLLLCIIHALSSDEELGYTAVPLLASTYPTKELETTQFGSTTSLEPLTPLKIPTQPTTPSTAPITIPKKTVSENLRAAWNSSEEVLSYLHPKHINNIVEIKRLMRMTDSYISEKYFGEHLVSSPTFSDFSVDDIDNGIVKDTILALMQQSSTGGDENMSSGNSPYSIEPSQPLVYTH